MRSLFELGRVRRAATPSVDGVGIARDSNHHQVDRLLELTRVLLNSWRCAGAGAGVILTVALTQALWSAPAIAATPPAIGEESVLDVAGTSATLQAQVNPEGVATTYRFEYDTSVYDSNAAHGVSAPSPEGSVGSGSALTTVTVHVQDLAPATVYHFRVVATSAGNETAYGEERTFTTQTAGSELRLPDGRQWEMVSQPNKHGATIYSIFEGVIQASEDGDAISYHTNAPTELEPQGFADSVQVLSTRGPGGWSSQDITTPHNEEVGAAVGVGGEYKLFSSDLSLAIVEPQGRFTPLSSQDTERTVYVRHDSTCLATPASCYTPLLTTADVAPGVEFGGDPKLVRGNVKFVGSTPDLSHIVLEPSEFRLSEFGLTSTPGDKGGLYEWTNGQLQLVSILPANEGGSPAYATSIGLGENTGVLGQNSRNAISDDGTRIIWTGSANGGEEHLYMRDTATDETVRLDQFQGGAPSGERLRPRFQTASSDGSKVFFASAERLTADSTASAMSSPGQPDLYEFDADSGKLTDLTVDTNPGESADVLHTVLGASEDGSYVYFLANGALAPGATPGDCPPLSFGGPEEHCNLYVVHNNGHEWTRPTFIANLAGTDEKDAATVESPDLTDATARVSPNGRYVAFMSLRSLTGYDTRDADSREPDEEVYIYDAALNRLVCASCDPTGARPVGAQYGGRLVDGDRVWAPGTWMAANVPGWSPYETSKAVYQSRYLSDDGRLFFNSNDALVPSDVNGTEDVYQYEPQGVGGCDAASPTFDKATGACVDLISAGSSSDESAFMDASADGGNVFFLTTSQLTSQDFDTGLDIYDARVCSASVPCASPVVSPPACSTGDSCKASPSPQPSIFGSPSSATFSGAGNVTPLAPKTGVGARSLTRPQKLSRALTACRKGPRKKRAVCEKRAKRRYGPKRAAGKANVKGGHR